jgi:hypothetical protein
MVILWQGEAMEQMFNDLYNERKREGEQGLAGFVLALPFLSLLILLVFHIEPPLGLLEPMLKSQNPDQPNVLSKLIVPGIFLMAAAAGLIARAPIVRTMQAGGNLFAHPVNLVFAAVILAYMLMLVAGLAADQFPCWMGVPNCD